MPNPMPASRRRWQATLIIALFVVAVAGAAGIGWWYARESPPHQGPIVVISVDGMQPRQLHAYGSTADTTPGIDALAADGVIFTRAYSHSPQSLPATASLLTGQLPFEHGVRGDAGFTLAPEVRTLAEQLRNRGFAAGAAVSSYSIRRETGTAQGFGFFDSQLTAAGEPPAVPPAVARDGLQTYGIAEQWMRMQDGQRYFVFLEVKQESADAVVSRLVQDLKDRDLYDDATIVLTAARGDAGAGAWLDDRSLAIPLIVKQPDAEGAGRNVATPVQQIDIVPTLLDFVRAPVPGGLRGRSLRPILDSDDGTIAPQPIYAETLEAAWRFGGTPVYALTQDGYRLIRAASDSLERVDAEVPLESTDASRLERLAAALDRLLTNRPVPLPANVPSADEAAQAALGHLPGLRTIQAPEPPIAQAEQEALARMHRDAARLVAARDHAGALAALRNVAGRRPDLAPVQFQIGALLARAGRFADAISAFVQAAMSRPDDPEVAAALARTHLRARQLDEAKARAAEAVTLADKARVPQLTADARETAMRVAFADGDAEGASVHADEAEKADAARPLRAFARGRVAYDEAKYDEALTAFQEAARAVRDGGRDVGDLHLYLGDTLARLDRYPEAEVEFREELRLFPDNLRAYTSLVTLYQASNREDAVQQTIDELLAAAPTPEGYATAARLWTITGERAKANALRAEARRRFRGDPAVATFN